MADSSLLYNKGSAGVDKAVCKHRKDSQGKHCAHYPAAAYKPTEVECYTHKCSYSIYGKAPRGNVHQGLGVVITERCQGDRYYGDNVEHDKHYGDRNLATASVVGNPIGEQSQQCNEYKYSGNHSTKVYQNTQKNNTLTLGIYLAK